MNAVIAFVMLLNTIIAPLAPRMDTSPAALNSDTDTGNLIDTTNTYDALSETMGRTPSTEEILFITVRAEGYALDDNRQEALTEKYHEFCTDECTTNQLIRLLSTYETWYAENGVVDVNADLKALEFYGLLIDNLAYKDALYERIEAALTAEYTPPVEVQEDAAPQKNYVAMWRARINFTPASPVNAAMSLNTSVDVIALGTADLGDLIDVERTYNELSRMMGRRPTIEEILYMTIWSEYWLVVKADTSRIGQDAIARSYYQFCGLDGCTHDELIKFLSGYQPWFDRPGYVDTNPVKAAEYLHMLLTHQYNYDCCGEFLYEQIDEILDLDYATEKRWTDGKCWQKASQWYGPAGAPPKGSSMGYGTSDYAIKAIPYRGRPGAYFYFLTWDQELRFSAQPLP